MAKGSSGDFAKMPESEYDAIIGLSFNSLTESKGINLDSLGKEPQISIKGGPGTSQKGMKGQPFPQD